MGNIIKVGMAETKKETKKEAKKEGDKDKAKPLDDSDISLMKRYGRGPYFESIKKAEEELKDYTGKINKLCGVKESDTGLAPPADWFLTVSCDNTYSAIRKCFRENSHSRSPAARRSLAAILSNPNT